MASPRRPVRFPRRRQHGHRPVAARGSRPFAHRAATPVPMEPAMSLLRPPRADAALRPRAALSHQPSAFSYQTSDVRGATTLSSALARRVTFEEVAQPLIGAWRSPLAPTAPLRPRPRLSARPPDRLTAFFLDPAWTWRR